MKMVTVKKLFMLASVLLSLILMMGCAGFEYAPKPPSTIMYYHKELPEADRAIVAAQKAGKDRECPEEFNALQQMVADTYTVYWSCRTQEAIAMAKEVTRKANALCPPRPMPRPEQTPAPEPTPVPPTPAPVPVPAPEPTPVKNIDKMTTRAHFAFGKAKLREDDMAELNKAVAFVKKYPGATIRLDGYTDGIGTDKYNMRLSAKRAEAMKKYLIKEAGVGESKITVIPHGKADPVGDNKTKKGRALNRRVEISILSE